MTEAAVETLRLTETTTPPPRLVLSRWGEPLPPPPPIARTLAQDDAEDAATIAGEHLPALGLGLGLRLRLRLNLGWSNPKPNPNLIPTPNDQVKRTRRRWWDRRRPSRYCTCLATPTRPIPTTRR